jgi:hypothetical protein
VLLIFPFVLEIYLTFVSSVWLVRFCDSRPSPRLWFLINLRIALLRGSVRSNCIMSKFSFLLPRLRRSVLLSLSVLFPAVCSLTHSVSVGWTHFLFFFHSAGRDLPLDFSCCSGQGHWVHSVPWLILSLIRFFRHCWPCGLEFSFSARVWVRKYHFSLLVFIRHRISQVDFFCSSSSWRRSLLIDFWLDFPHPALSPGVRFALCCS